MKIIVCLDDNNGMLFNNRRQSRDRVVVEDIISDLNGKKLLVSPFSESLFKDCNDAIVVDVDFLKNADCESVCFVENEELSSYENIDEIIIYRWNRVYPADFTCDIDLSKYNIADITEIVGNSHEKITKQRLVRG